MYNSMLIQPQRIKKENLMADFDEINFFEKF